MRFFTITVDGVAFTTTDGGVAERLQAELLDAVRDGPRWVLLPDGEQPISVLVSAGTSASATSWLAPVDESDGAHRDTFVDFEALEGPGRLAPPLA